MNNKDQLQHILIIRFSALGDVINTLPVASEIKRQLPRCRISWLVEDRAADIVKACPDVDRTIVFPRQPITSPQRGIFERIRTVASYMKELSRESYDAILDLQSNIKSSLHLLLMNANLKIGFSDQLARDGNTLFTHLHVTPPPSAIHRVDQFLSILSPLLQDAPGPAQFRILIDPQREQDMLKTLQKMGYPSKSYIAIHPGTSARGRLKQWDPKAYIDFINQVDHQVLLTWGPGEHDLVTSIARECSPAVTVAPPCTSVIDLAVVMKHARLCIGSDSGPLHLANAVGTTCLTLFGPKNPEIYAPYHSRERVIYKHVECSPCRQTTCDHHTCMRSITTQDLVDVLQQIEKSEMPSP